MSRGKRYEEPKLNMKKVFAVVILFIVIIMCIIMLKGIFTENEEQGNIISIDYFAAYKDNKWGVIDSNGNIVIEPSFSEMIIVPNSKEDVFLYTYDVNYEDGTYKTKAINSKNEGIFTNYEQVEAISSVDENQNLVYDGKVLKVQNGGKYGLINLEGKEILPCEYDSINLLQGVENTLIVSKDSSYGIVDNDGKVIIPPSYSEIQNLGNEASQGFIVKNSEGKYGIVDIGNSQVLELKYDAISKIHEGEYYVVTEGNNQKVVKRSGQEVLNANGKEITALLKNQENGVIYKVDNKYGVMNLSGEDVVEASYDELKEGKTGILIAKKGDKCGIIDLQENEKVDFKYNSINYNEKADIYITEDENYNNEVLDSNFSVKLTGIVTDLNDEKGYIEIRQSDEYKYYNFKFEEEKEAEIFTGNTLFVSKKDGKYGFVDKDGKVIVDYIYDDVGMQNSFGFAAIKKDGKWGAVDRNGNIVQEPTYQLDDYLQVDFIGGWYLGKDLNMNYYRK